MRRLLRTPRWLKSIGLGVVAVLLSVWLGSAFVSVQWVSAGRIIGIGYGAVYVAWNAVIPARRWRIERNRFPGVQLWLPERSHLFNGSTLVVAPLWIPIVVFAFPTMYLFWRDRRRILPHCCQTCGYDLTGNVSGVCPECGETISVEGVGE